MLSVGLPTSSSEPAEFHKQSMNTLPLVDTSPYFLNSYLSNNNMADMQTCEAHSDPEMTGPDCRKT